MLGHSFDEGIHVTPSAAFRIGRFEKQGLSVEIFAALFSAIEKRIVFRAEGHYLGKVRQAGNRFFLSNQESEGN